tara:strand:- start:959 stop:1441 length:483 start_codon:yes stop_codon:yes gene_type:complete
MRNVEVLENAENIALVNMAGLSGVKLSYAVTENAKTLGEEAPLIRNKLVYPQEYLKMRENFRNLFKKYALVDELGNLVVEEDLYVIDPKKELEYKKLIESKHSENQPILNKVQKIEEDYNRFLNEESNLTIKTVTLDDLPETVNPDQMKALFFMIVDTEE